MVLDQRIERRQAGTAPAWTGPQFGAVGRRGALIENRPVYATTWDASRTVSRVRWLEHRTPEGEIVTLDVSGTERTFNVKDAPPI